MTTIKLTQGKYTIIDDLDFERVNQWKWYFHGGYAHHSSKTVNGKRTTIPLHNFIMNTPKDMETDHKNHDTLDNRRGNLRIVTRSQNQCNQKKRIISKFKGITYIKGAKDNKWKCRIGYKTKLINIGNFRTDHQAALAYDLWANDLFGEYANTNFIKVTQ